MALYHPRCWLTRAGYITERLTRTAPQRVYFLNDAMSHGRLAESRAPLGLARQLAGAAGLTSAARFFDQQDIADARKLLPRASGDFRKGAFLAGNVIDAVTQSQPGDKDTRQGCRCVNALEMPSQRKLGDDFRVRIRIGVFPVCVEEWIINIKRLLPYIKGNNDAPASLL